MKFPLLCLGVGAALTLAACADKITESMVPDIPTVPDMSTVPDMLSVADIPDLPLQTPLQAHQAPIVPLQTTIHVGADVEAPADALQQAGLHGETRVFHGSVQDGIGAEK